jgi:hypothetical protein
MAIKTLQGSALQRLFVDPTRIRRRWLVYFDLLGFSDLVKETNLVNVFYTWELCLNDFHENLKRHPELEFANFSDSFLIYAPDDSARSFTRIDNTARWFFSHALLRRFPLRGAMACDEFYGDKQNGVFLGKALVMAHEFGQQFKWIGYTLAPSARSQLLKINHPECPCHFRQSEVPIKSSDPTRSAKLETIALLCGGGKGREHIIALEKMRQSSLDKMVARRSLPDQIEKVMEKYENTIKFIKLYEVA